MNLFLIFLKKMNLGIPVFVSWLYMVQNYQMEHQYSDRIVRLLQLYLLGDITEEERQELEDWCEEAPRNRRFLNKVYQEDLFSKERFVYEKIHDKRHCMLFEKRVEKSFSERYWSLVEICSRVVISYFSCRIMEVDP